MMRHALRGLAVVIAVAAILDPALQVERPQPIAVDLRVLDMDPRAEDVRRLVSDRLGDVIDLSGRRPPSHVVWIGNAIGDERRPQNTPVSVVLLPAPAPNVAVASVRQPSRAPIRQAVSIEAIYEASGVAGHTSVLFLRSDTVEVATVEHRWTSENDRFATRFRYVPPSAGVHRLVVGARPLAAERDTRDNQADVDVTVTNDALDVLVYEPRPSWNATFVRRALEADGRFRVASIARPSRSVYARNTSAPAATQLVADQLEPFDVVVVGAPDALRAGEVDALQRFARVRGGTIVFLADRRAAGSYASLLDSTTFDEVLLENPVKMVNDVAEELRASEFIIPRQPRVPSVTLATVAHGSSRIDAASVRPLGPGRIVYWGAADAWRFRGEGSSFARFWQSAIADLAVDAPAKLDLDVRPRIVAPGQEIDIRVAIRRTELREADGRLAIPAISARLVGSDGAAEAVRLWPSAEVGVFRGRVRTARAGKYDLHVTAAGISADAVVQVMDSSLHAPRGDGRALRVLASTTGGVVATDSDLGPLEQRLRSQAATREVRTVRPLRSMWWFTLFAVSLCAEWTLRRRGGLR